MDNATSDCIVSEQTGQITTSKKGRVSAGKPLFPWKSRYGPDLKLGLVKVIYLYGMHLSKGSDRLPKIKKLDDKWKFIADEFWKQPCCQLLRLSGDFKDVQPPSNLSVRSELGQILTEVAYAMHWDSGSMANLSQKEGDLPEYESLVRNILMEQEKERVAEENKNIQGKEKESNEVSILLNGLSKDSEAELKVTSKSIRKRDRERNNSSPDFTISTLDTTSSSNSQMMGSFTGKAMKYLDRLLSENDDEEVSFISKKTVTVDGDNYDRDVELQMLDRYKDMIWWNCLRRPGINDDENYDIMQAQFIGIDVLINIFSRKIFDLEYFKNELTKNELGNLTAHKLYLQFRRSYDDLTIDRNGRKILTNGEVTTPS